MRTLPVFALVAGIAVMHQAGAAAADVPALPGAPGTTEAAPHAAAEAAGLDSHGSAHGHSAGPAGYSAAHQDAAGGGAAHDVLHLCLAVVLSAALALLGWLLVRHGVLWLIPRLWAAASRRPPVGRPPRAVPGSVLLISLCVMRT